MTRPRFAVLAALAVVLGVAACGGTGSPNLASPDAGTLDAPPAPVDGGPSMFAACSKFDEPAVAVPAHVLGTLSTAAVEAPAGCATIQAPFGVESAGPDSVVRITGLVPGAPYVVHLQADADLAFYVATACDSATGPSSAACLLFEDDSSGPTEVGSFVAPASEVYVIVDYYQATAPRDDSFTLDVYAQQCADATACSGDTPACLDGQCVQCATSFDCTEPELSVCDTDQHTCVAGTSLCGTDDAHEPDDDGPAGAPVLTLGYDDDATISGVMCAAPLGESDYIGFQVTSLGDTWQLQLGWSGNRDLLLEIYDATGTQLGLSYWEKPEQITLTYLPVGTYYARVFEYATSTDTAAVNYTLTAQRTPGSACASAADCAAESRNQIYRGACTAGACVAIDGDGAVAQGGACDSESDCAAGLACPSFYFVANADTRELCEPTCAGDGDCAALGSDFVCTTYLDPNQCVEKCTADAQCPTDLDAEPDSGPWARLSCDLDTGRCLP